MRLPALALLVLILPGFSSATPGLEITTKDGEVYEDCEIMRVETDCLVIRHLVGIARIPREKLPGTLQDDTLMQSMLVKKSGTTQAMERARVQNVARLRTAQLPNESSTRTESTHSKDSSDLLAGPIVFVPPAAFFVYFLPTIVGRRRQSAGAIFALNLLLGWTILGWVAALVCARKRDKPAEQDSLASYHDNPFSDEPRFHHEESPKPSGP